MIGANAKAILLIFVRGVAASLGMVGRSSGMCAGFEWASAPTAVAAGFCFQICFVCIRWVISVAPLGMCEILLCCSGELWDVVN